MKAPAVASSSLTSKPTGDTVATDSSEALKRQRILKIVSFLAFMLLLFSFPEYFIAAKTDRILTVEALRVIETVECFCA